MPRNRIIYQSQAVALLIQNDAGNLVASGPNAHTNWKVLDGIQSLNYGVEVAREDVYQFGRLSAADRILLEPPTVTAEISMYYPTVNIGIADFTQLLTNSIKGSSNSQLAMAIDADAEDFKAKVGVETTLIQGANMSSFGYEASVGAIPTLTLGFEGTSMSYNVSGLDVDSVFAVDEMVDNQTGAGAQTLRNKIIPFTGVVISIADTVTSNGVTGVSGNVSLFTHFTNAQSANLSFDLGFEGLQRLGNADGMQYARVATLPATATLDLEAIAIDRGLGILFGTTLFSQKASAGTSLNAGGRADVAIVIGSTVGSIQTFKLQKATLDSSNYTAGMGDNATCSASFGVSISSTAPGAEDSALVFI